MTLYRGNSDDYDFTVHLTRFSGLLQKRGLVAGPREIADALEAFSVTDFNNKPKCYWVLRTLFVSKPDQIIFFDFAFERFWSFQKITDETASSGETMLFKGAKHFRKRTNPSFLVDNQQTSENVLFKPDYHGANKNNVAGYRNIEYFGLEKTSEMTKLAAEVLEALKGKKGRRKVANEAGKWLDFRKLVRNKLGVGGEPLYLSYYDRKIRPPRLAILLDVSGSMNKYTKALLRLCHECVAKTNQIDVYVFSMTLTDITSELRSKNYTDGLVKIGRKVDGWSGGTDIGNSVAKFRSDRQTKLSKNTTFILMSDGWDTGTPDKLHYELSRIKQSVKSIVWLNPLIGSENFSPDSASMKQSLPLLDVFASARDFESLKKIPSYIN